MTGTLVRNTAWLAGGRVVGQGMAVALTVVLARGLGTAGFGQYAFVGAIIVIGNVVTSFGTESLLIREIAARRGNPGNLLSVVLGLQLVLSAVFVLLVFAGAGWLPNRTDDLVLALRIYSLSLFPLAFSSVFSVALRGRERMDLAATLGVGTAALQTVAALAAVWAGAALPTLVLCLLVAQAVAAVFGWILCRVAQPGFTVAASAAPDALIALFNRVWPFALLSALAIVGQRLGVLLLGLLSGDTPAGWFAAASRVVEGAKLTHYAFLGAMLPLASRLGAENTSARLSLLVKQSRLVLFAIGLGAAIVASVFATPIVGLLYGAEYQPTVTALRILAWALLPYAAAAPAAQALVSTGHERIVLRASVMGVVVTAAFGAWLIPLVGVNGASLAVIAGETMRSALLFVEIRRIGTPRFTSDAVLDA